MNPNNLNEHEPGFLETLAGASIIFAVTITIAFLIWTAFSGMVTP